ncbi:MAG: acyl-CoA dehydrogenase family protein [Actinomycetota bacterium]|nr:acyl-CoA dehydrogenase family protein [Actinomycetota bacterium]
METRAEFRSFVDKEIAPYAEQFDRTETVPPDVFGKLSERRYWGALLPRDVGGLGLDMASFAALHEEVGRGCSSVRGLLTAHAMVAFAVQKWGTGEQKARWLPALASGEVIAAFALTEPEAGSDAGCITSQARKEAGGYRLAGRKKWITGAQVAGLFLVFARTERGIAAFLVERETPGLDIAPISGLLGARASMLGEVVLHDCHLPPSALLGPEGFGVGAVVTGALDLGRYSVACGCVGIIDGCLDASSSYASQRVSGSETLRDKQLIRRMISDMVCDLWAARLLCRRAGDLKEAGDPETIGATCMAKYFASEAAARASRNAVQIHGANGCSRAYPVERYFRDAKVMEIIEGSSEIQQLILVDEASRGRALVR